MFKPKCKRVAKYRRLWRERMAQAGWERVVRVCKSAARWFHAVCQRGDQAENNACHSSTIANRRGIVAGRFFCTGLADDRICRRFWECGRDLARTWRI